MAWIRMRGVSGLVYEPEAAPSIKRKHNCPDCFSCQMCPDSRCEECLRRKSCKSKRKGKHG